MVVYEWLVEELDGPEDGDIVDVNHWDTYAQAKAFAEGLEHYDIGVVRHDWRDGYCDRSWAYMSDGKLPEHFTDAGGARICSVPMRFHKEV